MERECVDANHMSLTEREKYLGIGSRWIISMDVEVTRDEEVRRRRNKFG